MNNELLQKIKQLAERGVGGEKENAEKMLKQLMKKYNISESELNSETIEMFETNVKDIFESKLLTQIHYSVCGNINEDKFVSYLPKNKKHAYIFCTKAEFIEIEAKFKFYKEIWKKQLNTFFSAFINTERIFPPKELMKITKDNNHELTKEDMEILKMSANLDKHNFYKQISY